MHPTQWITREPFGFGAKATLFFAAVAIQLPVVLLDADGIPRHALLASISVNHLSVYLLLRPRDGPALHG